MRIRVSEAFVRMVEDEFIRSLRPNSDERLRAEFCAWLRRRDWLAEISRSGRVFMGGRV